MIPTLVVGLILAATVVLAVTNARITGRYVLDLVAPLVAVSILAVALVVGLAS